MMFLHSDLQVLKTEDKGWGVFAMDDIEEMTLIECSPVIIMSGEDRLKIDQTRLHDYIFEWGPEAQQCAMATGYVPLYNHHSPSNAEYKMDFDKGCISVITIEKIASGEEIFINYHGDFDKNAPLWFEPK